MSSLPKTFKTPVADPSDGFKLYLKSQGASSVTIKNYLSDFNHLWGWLILTLKAELIPFDKDDPKTIINQISPQIVKQYKSFLLRNGNPISTTNRRLSSLRKFGKFCVSQGWIQGNPAKKVKNVPADAHLGGVHSATPEVLKEFQKHLEKEKVSPVTVKNYLSDLRHFLDWIEVIT